MPKNPKVPNSIVVRSRKDVRRWLSHNHRKNDGIWIITWKRPSPLYLSFGDVISELLCWGWIDSKSKGIDEERTSMFVTKRGPRSTWSAANKAKVDENRASGQMMAAGEAAIATAIENGMWGFLDDVERLEVPGDLDLALGAELRSVWEGYPRSVKRSALEWVKTAKRDQTRLKRIEDIKASAKRGLRPTPFRN